MSYQRARNRPVLPMPYTPVEIIVQLATLSILIAAWYMARKYYLQLPETIATHFNLSGEPDGYGSKSTIFAIPAIMSVVCVIMALLSQIPEQFNYLVTITEENAEREYRKGRMLLFVVSLLIALLAVWIVREMGSGQVPS